MNLDVIITGGGIVGLATRRVLLGERVAAFLEMVMGFHHALTRRENIFHHVAIW